MIIGDSAGEHLALCMGLRLPDDENIALKPRKIVVYNHRNEGLAERINAEGLMFGLWFEPEMVNPDSELYRKHPEWVISVPNINPSLCRHQSMPDLANPEVCDYIIDAVGSILETANITYVKWDYNRMMTDMPFKGYNHKYTLGLYKVFDALTSRFPMCFLRGVQVAEDGLTLECLHIHHRYGQVITLMQFQD